MKLPYLHITSKRDAQNLLLGDPDPPIEALISIGDPDEKELTGHKTVKHYLRLGFHDILAKDDGKEKKKGIMKAPRKEDVQKIIDFAKEIKETNGVLIHCYAGASRSPASAIICMVTWLGKEHIEEAVKHIFSIKQFHPNRTMIHYADELYECNGELNRTVRRYQNDF